jgi:hypothetical protein
MVAWMIYHEDHTMHVFVFHRFQSKPKTIDLHLFEIYYLKSYMRIRYSFNEFNRKNIKLCFDLNKKKKQIFDEI